MSAHVERGTVLCEYLGRDVCGLHTFRTPDCEAKMSDCFLGALNAHPEVARLHAEAMESGEAWA